MGKNRGSIYFFFAIIIAVGISFLAHSPMVKADTTDILAAGPIKGPFILIWDDAIPNFAQAVVYNKNHDEYLVVWTSAQDDWTWDLWGRRVSGDGTLFPQFCIATSAGKKLDVADATYSTVQDRYFVVFENPYGENDMDIRAVSFSFDGTDFSSWLIVDMAELDQKSPAVTYNEGTDDYLVVYANYLAVNKAEILGRRFDAADDSWLEPTPVQIATSSGQSREYPDVAYNAAQGNYLVAYGYFQTSPTTRSIIAAKIVPGDLSSPGPERQVGPEDEVGYVSVAAGKNEFMVTWDVWANFAFIRARRVQYDGTPLGPAGGFSISADGLYEDEAHWFPSAAANRLGYWVAWETQGWHSYKNEVLGNFMGMGKDQAVGPEYDVDVDVLNRYRPKIACSWMGKCLMADYYYPDDNPNSDSEIHGRFLSWHEIFLPFVKR